MITTAAYCHREMIELKKTWIDIKRADGDKINAEDIMEIDLLFLIASILLGVLTKGDIKE